MRAEVQSYLLNDALRGVSYLPPDPDYINIVADSTAQYLKIYATGKGYGDYIYTSCPATVYEDGSVILQNARKFCQSMAEFKLDIGFHVPQGDDKLQVQSGKRRFKFEQIHSSEFSFKIPDDFNDALQVANQFNLSGFLKECLKLKNFQEPNDEFRVWKETIRVIVEQGGMVQLDLAEGSIFARNRYQSSALNPATYYLMVKNLVKAWQMFKNDSRGHVVVCSDRLCITNGTTYYFIVDAEMNYPNVDAVWQKKLNKRMFSCPVLLENLKGAAKTAAILVKESTKFGESDAVHVILQDNGAHLVVEQQFHEHIEYEGNMELLSDQSRWVNGIKFNSSYSPTKIFDALKNIYNSEVVFLSPVDSNDGNSPLVISDGIGFEIAIGRKYTRSSVGV